MNPHDLELLTELQTEIRRLIYDVQLRTLRASRRFANTVAHTGPPARPHRRITVTTR